MLNWFLGNNTKNHLPSWDWHPQKSSFHHRLWSMNLSSKTDPSSPYMWLIPRVGKSKHFSSGVYLKQSISESLLSGLRYLNQYVISIQYCASEVDSEEKEVCYLVLNKEIDALKLYTWISFKHRSLMPLLRQNTQEQLDKEKVFLKDRNPIINCYILSLLQKYSLACINFSRLSFCISVSSPLGVWFFFFYQYNCTVDTII